MKDLFITIPRCINEIIVALGVLGIIALNKKYHSFFAKVAVTTILFMLLWRCVYGLTSSRYAAGLIIPFVIYSAYFIVSVKNKLFVPPFAILLVFTFCLFLRKNYNISPINSHLCIISEFHDRYNNTRENCILLTPTKDAHRIKYLEKNNNPFQYYSDKKTIEDVRSFIQEYKIVNTKLLYDIIINSDEDFIITDIFPYQTYKKVLSISQSKNKKHSVYLIDSKSHIQIIPFSKTIQSQSGILTNGDMELLDSPEISFQKLKSHIDDYSLYYEFDPTVRTPQNAYFYNSGLYTQCLPQYNCTSINPISGKYSAELKIDNGVAYLFFSQKFYNGTYHFSFIVKGKVGTRVCMVCEVRKNKQWNAIPLVYFFIPDKRLYMLQTDFTFEDLGNDDFFFVGAAVGEGEAVFDNFSLSSETVN